MSTLTVHAAHLESESHETSWRYSGWRVTLAASLASAAGFGSILIYSFSGFIKPLTAEFGWSRQTISAAFACASFTLGLCSPGLGYLLDRFGPRRVILPCIAVFAAAFASLALLRDNLVQLFATFILIGAVGNATAQMGYARAVSTWFNRRRGSALALMMVGSSLGMIAMPVLTQRLLSDIGWRKSYAVIGALPMLIAFPIAAVFVRETQRLPIARPPQMTDNVSALRSRAYWILLLTLVVGAMSNTGIITQLSALLTDTGIKPTNAGYAIASVGCASFLGRLITGWLLDRFFAPRVGMALLFGTACGMGLLARAENFGTAVIACVLLGFSMGGESDVTPYLLGRYFGLRRLGLLYGWTWTAYAVAAALGSLLLGTAFDRSGSYGGLLVVFSAAALLGGLLMLGMPSYPEKAEQ
jgi:MFS family permease